MKVVAFLFNTATIALSHQKIINEDWDKYMVLNFKNLYLSKIELQVKVFKFKVQCSGRGASLLRQDNTRFFQKLLPMFLNAFATLGTELADVLLQ